MKRIDKLSNYLNPASVFISLAIIFGILFLFIFPPMTAPDEIGHFSKAYAFAEGKVIPSYNSEIEGNQFKSWNKLGFYQPKSIIDLNTNSIEVDYNPDSTYDYSLLKLDNYTNQNKVFIPLGGQVSYSFIQYIPQILGIGIAKKFTTSILSIYFLAKLFNFIAYIIVIVLAIKITKFAKWGFALLGLNPLLLELATSTSGDAFTDAISFLFVALLSKLIFENHLNKKILYISFVVMIALVQMKPTLIVFGLLFFLIPNQHFSVLNKLKWGSIVFAVSIISYYMWGKLFPNQDFLYQDFGQPSKQLSYILQDPFSFVLVIKNTLIKHYRFLIHSSAGQFALLNRNIPFDLVKLYYGLLFLSLFIPNKRKMGLSLANRVIILIFFITYVLLSFLALYQIWTPVGSDVIFGLQGRYFIPISSAVLLAFVPNKTMKKDYLSGFLLIGILIILLYTSTMLLKSYGIL
ncbi:DUF2142 domain-containing protein [Streptococcus sp. sy018]|uniref:DUF2142 domain-containing protein n=1 Tax=Streptococcus sp. sy018 TaxID=2600147 RepID=UPI0016441DAF|nr:DUF2142 domain-containing protein [Streptococcus sp. sy018]